MVRKKEGNDIEQYPRFVPIDRNIVLSNEPQHDKTNKIIVPSEDSDQPGHPPSLMSLCCAL